MREIIGHEMYDIGRTLSKCSSTLPSNAGAETRTTVPRLTSFIRFVRVVIQAESRSKHLPTDTSARHSTASRKTPCIPTKIVDLRPSLSPIHVYAESLHDINAASRKPPSHARRTIKQHISKCFQRCKQASDRLAHTTLKPIPARRTGAASSRPRRTPASPA